MATLNIKPDSAERIALIADALGVPADAPMVEWSAEGEADGAMLTVTMKRRVTTEAITRILNA